jgi:hypothetical protein
MARPKGSKNKTKPAAKAKAVKPPKEPAAEVGPAGQARKAISQASLKSLMKSCASFKAEADSSNGSMREKIAYAVEHNHLNKGVFALIRRLDKLEAEKLLIFLEDLELYLDFSGLNDRADSVGKLPLESPEKPADAENEDEGTDPAPEASEGNVTRLKPAAA